MMPEIDPYMPEYPVMPKDFAGRKESIKTLKEALRYTASARPINVAVIGEWGVGKTALLLKIQEISKKDYSAIPCIVDVQSGQTSEATLDAIIQKVTHHIQQEYPSITLPTGGIKEMSRPRLDKIERITDGSSHPATLFESNLQILWNIIPNKDRIILIMVDNLEFLGKDDLTRMVEAIRNVFQALPRSGCKIMIILSGKQIFYEQF